MLVAGLRFRFRVWWSGYMAVVRIQSAFRGRRARRRVVRLVDERRALVRAANVALVQRAYRALLARRYVAVSLLLLVPPNEPTPFSRYYARWRHRMIAAARLVQAASRRRIAVKLRRWRVAHVPRRAVPPWDGVAAFLVGPALPFYRDSQLAQRRERGAEVIQVMARHLMLSASNRMVFVYVVE